MNVPRSVSKLLVSKVTRVLLVFLGTVYFARALGASGIGTFFLFQALLQLLTDATDFGLRDAVAKRVSETGDFAGYASTGIALKLVPMAVLVGAVLLTRPVLNGYMGADIAVYLGVGIVVYEAAQLMASVLSGVLRPGERAILRIVQKVVWIGGSVVLIETTGYGVRALVYTSILGYVAMFLVGYYKRPIAFARPTRRHARSLVDFAKFGYVGLVGRHVYSWVDLTVIGLLLTPAAVGAYEIAWRVSQMAAILVGPITTVIFPQMSAWSAEGSTDRVGELFLTATTYGLILVVPAIFGAAILSESILEYLFGQEFVAASVVLVVLMVDKLFHTAYRIGKKTLNALDRPDLMARATLTMLVLNVALNLGLVATVGLVGAAIGTTVSVAVSALLQFRYLSRLVPFALPVREVAWFVASSIVMSAALLALRATVGVDSTLELFAVVGTGAVVYGVVVMTSSRIRSEFVTLAREAVAGRRA